MAKNNGVWCMSILDNQGTRLHVVNVDFNVLKLAHREAGSNQQRHTSINWKPSEARAVKFLNALNDNQFKLKGE